MPDVTWTYNAVTGEMESTPNSIRQMPGPDLSFAWLVGKFSLLSLAPKRFSS